MGIKERQESDREAVRRAILDAARDLFVADGFQHVSIRKIAERIEYSPAAIYGYFPSKDDIFFALAEEGFRLLASAISSTGPRSTRCRQLERVRADLLAALRIQLRAPAVLRPDVRRPDRCRGSAASTSDSRSPARSSGARRGPPGVRCARAICLRRSRRTLSSGCVSMARSSASPSCVCPIGWPRVKTPMLLARDVLERHAGRPRRRALNPSASADCPHDRRPALADAHAS